MFNPSTWGVDAMGWVEGFGEDGGGVSSVAVDFRRAEKDAIAGAESGQPAGV